MRIRPPCHEDAAEQGRAGIEPHDLRRRRHHPPAEHVPGLVERREAEAQQAALGEPDDPAHDPGRLLDELELVCAGIEGQENGEDLSFSCVA